VDHCRTQRLSELSSHRTTFVIQRERTDKKNGQYSCEIAYGITSRAPEQADPQRVLATNRGHWSVENCCHYIIDWNYDEDRSRIRTGHGGNKEIKALLKQKGANYARDFQFLILEVTDLNANKEESRNHSSTS